MKRLKDDLDDILEKKRIRTVFQPIVSLRNGEIIGYEALSRVVQPDKIRETEELFRLAGLYGKIWELEQLCRSKTLKRFYELSPKGNVKKLFLNVNPMVIYDNQFYQGFTSKHLEKYGLNAEGTVFEVTERGAVEDMRGFTETIRHYKQQGYKIAIDDAGSCYSGLNLICDIVPHYLKLDMKLIHDIHKDGIKRAMVKAMVEFAGLTRIELVAEGIECREELDTLLKLGVHNGQGYFLRKPNEELKGVDDAALKIIQRYNSKKTIVNMQNDDIREYRVALFKPEKYKAYKAYYEKYGFEKADKLLEMIKSVVAGNLSENEYMIMISEDTMMAVILKQDFKTKCECIIGEFERKIKDYYTEEDWNRGYIEGVNKNGEAKEYPIIAISAERVV